MEKILFVCWGNVGRSQMAEAFYNTLNQTPDSWSAGTDTTIHERHIHPTKNIINVMKECNIDVSKQDVKIITQKTIDESETIIVMCKKDKCPDFLLTSDKTIFWENIVDPEHMSLDDTFKIREEIHAKVKQLI